MENSIYTAEESKVIAMNILKQLGGNVFITMTGAKDLKHGHDGSLIFMLPIGKAKWVKISLVKDLYNVIFYKKNAEEKCRLDGVLNQNLKEEFSRITGLCVSLI